jgi:predicted RNA-binding Zn-ribbon protein involved in translation (DUF1610 family)
MMPRHATMCTNLNHRRSDAPVRFCPSCGETVNAKVNALRCASTQHDVQRRGGATFCVDCGERLATRTP